MASSVAGWFSSPAARKARSKLSATASKSRVKPAIAYRPASVFSRAARRRVFSSSAAKPQDTVIQLGDFFGSRVLAASPRAVGLLPAHRCPGRVPRTGRHLAGNHVHSWLCFAVVVSPAWACTRGGGLFQHPRDHFRCVIDDRDQFGVIQPGGAYNAQNADDFAVLVPIRGDNH